VSEGARRVFVYPERHAAVRGVFLILIYFGGVKMLLSAIFNPIMLPGVLFLGFFAWLLTSLFLRQRPIAVTEDRIDDLLGRWRWRTIAWRDMDRIEKRIVPEQVNAEGGISPRTEQILFRSGRRSVLVTSAVEDFGTLKRRVTEQAKRRGIELVLLAEPRVLWYPPLLTQLDEL
jgi:hypothetical protein